MSGPTAAEAAARSPAGSPDRSRLGCRGCASRRPASGFSPDAPVAADSAPGAVVVRSPASACGRRRDRFDLLRFPARGFTPAGHRQVQLELVWRSRCGHETSDLLALSFNPLLGTVRAFSRRVGLLRPLLTSASCPSGLRTRCRSLGVRPTAFIAHPPDLQFWPSMDVDFANSCPLVRPALPHIRFLFVGSRLCSTLPSDGPSRFRPCALLVLHLHQVAQGTFTPKLSDMSDTQDALRRL